MTTGWPPGLLQDDSRKLSDWFSSRVDARWTVRQVCAEIERNRMTDKQPEALELADMLDAAGLPRGGAILRTQHAAIERKDALLLYAISALEHLGGCSTATQRVADAIKQEISQ